MQLNQCEIYLYKSQYVRHVFWLRFTQIKLAISFFYSFSLFSLVLYMWREAKRVSSFASQNITLRCQVWASAGWDSHAAADPRCSPDYSKCSLFINSGIYLPLGEGFGYHNNVFFLRLRANSSRLFDLRHDARLLFAHAGAYISMGVFIYQWDQNTIGMYVFSTENVFVWRTFLSE